MCVTHTHSHTRRQTALLFGRCVGLPLVPNDPPRNSKCSVFFGVGNHIVQKHHVISVQMLFSNHMPDESVLQGSKTLLFAVTM